MFFLASSHLCAFTSLILLRTLDMATQLRTNRHHCSYCSKHYSRGDSLTAHVRAVHGETELRCENCNIQFTTLQSQVRHNSVHHAQKKSYKCATCLKCFSRKDSLRLHEKHHQNIKSYCWSCLKSFPSENALLRHRRTHGKDGEVTYKQSSTPCRLCSGRFGSAMITILYKNPHQCTVCLKTFKECWLFECHQREHHTCEMVPIQGRTGMGTHRQVFTRNDNSQKVGHQCSVCFKLFSSKQSMERHKSTAHKKHKKTPKHAS